MSLITINAELWDAIVEENVALKEEVVHLKTHNENLQMLIIAHNRKAKNQAHCIDLVPDSDTEL